MESIIYNLHNNFNFGLWLLASMACFGSLNKMKHNETKPCIIGAMLLMALGCGGNFLAIWYEQWVMYADTAVAGGVLALVLGTQRTESWFMERWRNPIASIVAAAAALVFLFGLVNPARAQSYDPETGSYYVKPETMKICADNGGCVMVTNRWLTQLRADLTEMKKMAERLKRQQADSCTPMDSMTPAPKIARARPQ